MPLSPIARRGVGLAAFLLSFHTLLALGLTPGLFAAVIVVLGIIYYRVGYLGAATIALALLAVTLLYALTIKLTGLDDSIYYRPHERLVTYDYRKNHRAYQPHARVDMQMPHGDLQSMTQMPIAQPRRVVFQTDADGFRNDGDYRGQPYVLVGDSFIVAVGDTQADTLTNQLSRDYGIASYNLGHPGDPFDYYTYIRAFRERHGNKAVFLIFLFEGNDFLEKLPELSARNYSRGELFWKRYYNLFSESGTYRLTRSLIKRLTKQGEIERSKNVASYAIHGHSMAFYVPYIEASRAASYRPDSSVETIIRAVGERPAKLFFIPTKYRVYHKHIAPQESLPNTYWDYLDGVCRKYDFECVNLTEPLVKAADAKLASGEFIWWRDDTHWNASGIAVAARIVAEKIKVESASGRR